ncbi:type III-A CRISPR-associated RAMP protein Csm3 [Ligilactobacillus agilis]|uniref:type III-A CRISPR-associated RAMP protein Csm3 n=1 Tax=Ligilactobacillus agilis TaxID=1601 RepID=UPI0034E29D5D
MKFAKLKFTGKIILRSGLHIGGSSEFAAIGAIDSPVIKDSVTKLPLIPGSSLKGKMRTLLAQVYNEQIANNPNEDNEKITRLFGAAEGGGADGKSPIQARLLFRDSLLSNAKELLESGAEAFTEVKSENTIDRVKMTAMPRQIERVVRGSEFNFELIYDVRDFSQVKEDLKVILDGLKLLELDYLGGSGSRGYGAIKFDDLRAETIFGDYDVTALNTKLGEQDGI